MTQTGGDCQAESVDPNDSSTVSSEPPDIDTLSLNGNDVSSSDDDAPTSTAAWTAARQLGSHMLGPGNLTRFGREEQERRPRHSNGKRQRG